ncbi:MAG TPA: hypothetical protein VFS76_04680 [Pyrinomonadaceae bacterium]|nr:hypothetical protein [Pyrinomonadaceae bacterium]
MEQAKQARGAIESLFVNDVIAQSDSTWAWGQFFHDTREHKQYGIYGTSAGTQVLILSGHGPGDRYVLGARKLLQESYTSRDPNNRFYKDHHYDRVYKLTSLIESESADQETTAEPSAAMQDLISRLLPEQGWGEFCNSDLDKDESRITSTSVALLALSKYRKFRATPECEKAITWLCRRLTEKLAPAIYELALGTLALIEYRSLSDRVSTLDETVTLSTNRLAEWARSRKHVLLGADESHHYPTSSDGSRGNRYLFFLPDCLAALAFLRLGSPQGTRTYVLNVVHFFVKSIIDKGGFRSVSRNHFCTVDHLWIYRLLIEFVSKQAITLLPQPFYFWAAMPTLAKLITSLGFLAVGTMGLYFNLSSALSGNRKSVFLTVLSTVALGLFTRSVWEQFKGKAND